MPEALQDFYAIVGRFDAVMESHNRFYPPDNFTRIDDKLIFCEENQVVVYWGYNREHGWRTDPAVYQGINGDEIDWRLEASQLSDFLVGMTYWQALWGGLPHFRLGAATESVRELAAPWPMVYMDEDSQLFSRGALVFAITLRDEGVEVQASGLAESDLEDLWRALGMESKR